ncbi:MAG: hypothetical protein JOZ82_03180 [Marmoricola sp.]|nr:hypothetical protein [Marmoricola sp.]
MTRWRGRAALTALVAAGVLWAWLPAPAFADVCTDNPSCVDPGTGDTGGGFPAASLVPMVLALLVAIGVTAYRVSTARDMARKAGMDTADATKVALLENEGLSATYLASELRGNRSGSFTAPPSSPPRTTAERLEELDRLRQQGLVSDTEYAQHRSAILDGV